MSLSDPTSPVKDGLHATISPAAILGKPNSLSTSPPGPGSPMPPAASLATPSPPPEVEQTLAKLTAHRNVIGCLVLSWPDALVIRAGGQAFDPSGPGARDRAEKLKSVVRMVRNTIDVMNKEVSAVDGEQGDELGFVRIRTKKYEMMISPSDKYLLVVLQDPTIAT